MVSFAADSLDGVKGKIPVRVPLVKRADNA